MDLLERSGPLAALAECRRRAATGHGGVVLVTGEPGIGKTTLVSAFAATTDGGRVLRGFCDDLATPRPLGPLRDLAGAVGAPLAEALAGRTPPAEVHERLLAELRLPPAPTVLVLEDVHWADDATVDVVRTLGRRIADLPAVLVLTYRDGDLGADHPLRAALAVLPPAVVTRLPLAPLSPEAVAGLFGDDGAAVHALTGGNPFYVTELLAGRPQALPPSIADAVQGRVAALAPPARRLVELVSVVPARIATDVLDAVLPGWEEAAEEPERSRMLEVDARWVRFRHELARTAVEAGLTVAGRRRLHEAVLTVLRDRDADPAELVHHAEAAGDVEALAAAALPAARRAAAAGANREAYAHYLRAAVFADRLPTAERAALAEELASAAYLVGRIPEALSAIGEAVAAHRALGDQLGLGRCVRIRSRLHWYEGDGPTARADAALAVELLEPLGESAELARACSALSQLAMLADEREATLTWGRRAAELAERVGDPGTRAHALANVGTTLAFTDPQDLATLAEAHAVADACGERHEGVRALVNAGWAELLWIRPGDARDLLARADAYATRYEVDSLLAYLRVAEAWLDARAGSWERPEAVARAAAAGSASVTQILAKTVLAEIAVRRGDDDAAERLADVAAQVDRTGEIVRIEPVLELQVEQALLTGAEPPVERVHRTLALAEATGRFGWGGARPAAWAVLAGVPATFDGPAPPPHTAMLTGDWAGAAAAFGEAGWPYDRALFLSLLDDRAALTDALETARQLGAAPLAGRIARRMRALGMAVPHGRRDSTRAHPAGLTERQVEVLRLVAEGLSNAEIADRLVVSPRTAEHHVAAVLMKLDSPTRRDAVRKAGGLGLLSS